MRPTDIVTAVVPDAPDERDLLWEPEHGDLPLPDAVPPDQYRELAGVTWHQRGQECTGFALAAIANASIRRHLGDPDAPPVSRRMLYESAQLHDDRDYEQGSTLRGALKGWRRTGVALDELWPYDPDDEDGRVHGTLTLARLLDARHRPLIGYRRIPSDDVDRMRRALADGHALFASAQTHVGWYRLYLPDALPRIERRPDDDEKGGHAFVIAGYDADGFWVHNSWGPEWGTEGYAVLPYAEWEVDGHDTWVVDLDPDTLADGRGQTSHGGPSGPPSAEEVASYRDLWPHLVVLRDDGSLASNGLYEMDEGSFGVIRYLFGERTSDWSTRRLVVVVDDGREPVASVVERFRTLRDRYLDVEIYPIFVVWETAWGADLADELDRWVGYTAERDDVVDAALGLTDPVVRVAVKASVARPVWHELVARSRRAADVKGGARALASALAKKRRQMDFEIHLVTSGVGDLLQSVLLGVLPRPVATATVAASATPLDQAVDAYGGALSIGQLEELVLLSRASAHDDGDAWRMGPVESSLLDVVAQLLAPGGSDDVVELLGRDPADDLDRIGRVTRRSGVADLHEQAIDTILAHEPPVVAPPSTPKVVDDLADLPRDPLARAEALARRKS